MRLMSYPRAERRSECRINNVAGVWRSGRPEQPHLHLLIGDGAMLNPPGNDHQLARTHLDQSVAIFDPEVSSHPEEPLVPVVMVKPDELAAKLDKLHVLAVQLTNHPGSPVFPDLRELLSEVDLVRGGSWSEAG